MEGEAVEAVAMHLPLEVLLRCQSVCMHWKVTIEKAGYLWKSVVLSRDLRPRLPPIALQKMVRCARGKLQELDLRGCAKVDCSQLHDEEEALGEYLEVIRLNREDHSKSLPPALGACGGFPHLRVLDLSWCPGVDDELISSICNTSCANSIQDLLLRGCLVSDQGVMNAARACRRLRVLDIGAWPYSRLRGVRSVTDVSLFFIAQCAAFRSEEFLLESLCIAGRRGTTDEGLDALIEYLPFLKRVDVRSCSSITQPSVTSDGEADGELSDNAIWRIGRNNNRVEIITDSYPSGLTTPDNYAEEYGVLEGWSDMQTASGLWRLLQSVTAVRTAAEMQARSTAEAQAADMLAEAAEVLSRASEIYSQANEMQQQASEILSRVTEVQAQVSVMHGQAQEQGNAAALAQAAQMQAQVAQMQVHAAQMQVHAAQMQIRATEMQGQATEMQASALNIRAQAASLSFSDFAHNTLHSILRGRFQLQVVYGDEEGGEERSAPSAEENDEAGARVTEIPTREENGRTASPVDGTLERQMEQVGQQEVSEARDSEHVPPPAAAAAAAAAPSPTAASSFQSREEDLTERYPPWAQSRLEAVRAETLRLTEAVRNLTAEAERVRMQQGSRSSSLSYRAENVARRAEETLRLAQAARSLSADINRVTASAMTNSSAPDAESRAGEDVSADETSSARGGADSDASETEASLFRNEREKSDQNVFTSTAEVEVAENRTDHEANRSFSPEVSEGTDEEQTTKAAEEAETSEDENLPHEIERRREAAESVAAVEAR
eukprot:763839-Hanusia_phi.AAC.1